MMTFLRWAMIAALPLVFVVTPAWGESIRGLYFQVRGATSANDGDAAASGSDSLGGHAIMGWRVKEGSHNGVRLDGLAVAAVAATRGTIEIGNSAQVRTAILIDDRAAPEQQEALVRLARKLTEDRLGEIVSVTPVKFDLRIAEGCACGHVVFTAGDVYVRTRAVLASDPAEFRAKRHESALGNVFYSYNAVTAEYSCAIPDAQGRSTPVTGENLPTALVGGF